MPTAHDIRPTGRQAVAFADDQVMQYVEYSVSPRFTLTDSRRASASRKPRRSRISRLLGL